MKMKNYTFKISIPIGNTDVLDTIVKIKVKSDGISEGRELVSRILDGHYAYEHEELLTKKQKKLL
jgi:hypothetical protein